MARSPSSISRRLEASLAAYQNKDFETSLIHFFPALDKVAKKRRSKAGVGERIRQFLKDEEVLISAIGVGNIFKNCTFNGVTFEDAIYKFGRTSIAHEGELDERLEFTESGSLLIGERWILPSNYIFALCIAVMAAPECTGEALTTEGSVVIYGRRWLTNEIWGNAAEIKAHIAESWGDPHLFT